MQMRIHQGNIWDIYPHTDLFLFTSNGVVNNGKLVMGAGIAKQVRDRFKGIDAAIGKTILSGGYNLNNPYGLLLSPNKGKVGLFQTKLHWKDESPLWLVEKSTKMLIEWANNNPNKRIDMTYPAIANGGRTVDEIYPIIQHLPDNVNVWRL